MNEHTGERNPQLSTLITLGTLILIVGILLLSGEAWQIVRGMATQRQQWQYAIEAPRDEDLSKRLRELGTGGWEIVSARRAGSETGGKMEYAYEMILRRPSDITDALLPPTPAPR